MDALVLRLNLTAAWMQRLPETTTKGKREREEADIHERRRRFRNADTRGITEERFRGRRDVTYVTQYARCRLCPGHLFGRERLARAGARIRRDSRYQKSGRGSASALITPRRRSYFTPRSSIIHAVNNAPLFRVTLYRVSPSFLPSFLSIPSPARVRELPKSYPREVTGRAYPGGMGKGGGGTFLSLQV